MNIPLPKHSDDLRIRHYKCLTNPTFIKPEGEVLTVLEQVEFLSLFTGISEKKLLTVNAMDIVTMYNHLCDLFNDMHIAKRPPKEITLNGQVFEMINPDKVGVGWHKDFRDQNQAENIKNDPVQLACLFYFPKGQLYGDIDKNDNLLHPISERYNTFDTYMPLKVFLEASAFFLTESERSMRVYTENRKNQSLVKNLTSLNHSNGRSKSTS